MNIFNFKFYKSLKRRFSLRNSNHDEPELGIMESGLQSTPSRQRQGTSAHSSGDKSHENVHDDSLQTPALSLPNRHDGEELEELESVFLSLDSDQSETDDDDKVVDDTDDTSSRQAARAFMESPMTEEKQTDREFSSILYTTTTRQQRVANLRSLSLLNAHHISMETVTKPQTYHICWLIDEESFNFTFLKNQKKSAPHTNNHHNEAETQGSNHGAGILEAEILQNGIAFKLELCISGWKNSSRGFCAFYLTIPHQSNTQTDGKQKQEKEKEEEKQPLVARYTVCLTDVNHSKQSSIRDDFHLGVGFPNFCNEHKLFEAHQKHEHKKLAIDVQIEIFESKLTVKRLQQVLYDRFVEEFEVTTTCNTTLHQLQKKNKKKQKQKQTNKMHVDDHEHIQTSLLAKMYQDGVYSDVVIKCQSELGESKSINVHKCVLIHSSLVFQKMFDVSSNSRDCVGFLESQRNEINLENAHWPYRIIKQLVEFLYFDQICREFCQRIEDVFQLFCIAEYFQIEALITECCRQFLISLTPNNVCFLLLKFANHNYQYQHIKQVEFLMAHDVLWRYMVKHIKKVQQTTYYKQILHQHPFVMNQLIEKITQ